MTVSTRALRTSTMLLIALLAAPAIAAAQYIGVKGGMNWGTINVTPSQAPEVYGQRTGPVAGFFFASNSDERVGLQWELLYTQKGAAASGPFVGTLRLDYGEIPLMARILIASGSSVRVHVNAGVSADYLLTARQTVAGVTTGLTSQFERTDVCAVFGGSVALSRGLIDVRYGLGLRNLFKNSPASTAKSRTLSVTAGIWF